MRLVKTLKYEGSINHFRSLMDSFLISIDYQWKVEGYDALDIHYERDLRAPGREAWTVEHHFREDEPHDNCYASIFAFESLPNLTDVKFFDARQFFDGGSKRDFNEAGGVSWYDAQPIGESLLILSNEIERLWKEFVPESTPEEPKTNNLNDWFVYFHQVKHQKRITLRDIAKKTRYSYDYVREKHGQFIKGLEGDSK